MKETKHEFNRINTFKLAREGTNYAYNCICYHDQLQSHSHQPKCTCIKRLSIKKSRQMEKTDTTACTTDGEDAMVIDKAKFKRSGSENSPVK